MRLHLPLVLSIVFAFALVGNSEAQGRGEDTLRVRLAEEAAGRWIALVDSARYKASWDSAAANFRASISPADWNSAVSSARSAINPLSDRRIVSSEYTRELPDAPPGDYVVLQYSAVGRDETRVMETITVTLERRRTWRVIGYFVRPE